LGDRTPGRSPGAASAGTCWQEQRRASTLHIFHHHGRIWDLQRLPGDPEMRRDEAAIGDGFAWKGDPAAR
jgi:hypothetical protein